MIEKKCSVCDGWGVVQKDVPYTHPDFGKSFPCPKCRTYHDLRLERIRQLSRLDDYDNKTFENFKQYFDFYSLNENDELLNAYEQALMFADQKFDSKWFVLVGGTGIGKTHLAAAIGQRLVEHGRRTIFITVPDLLDDLRATFAPSSGVTYSQEFDMLCNVDVLVMDDLGVESNSEWAQEKLYQIINHRYNRQLTTVITSNVSFSEMDPRIASRLQDMSISNVLYVELPDFRVRDRIENTELEELSLLKIYPNMTFETLNYDVFGGDTLQKTVGKLRALIDVRRGFVVIHGITGSGKTHLAAAAGHEWHRRHRHRPIFTNTSTLIDYFRAGFDSVSRRSLDDRIKTITNTSLLILDNLRITGKTSEWANDKLAQILDFRYVRALPTIITFSNEMASNLREYQPFVYSRLMDRGIVAWCGLATDDFRQVYGHRST